MQLDINNITKSFGEKEVLHGVSFSVVSGRAVTGRAPWNSIATLEALIMVSLAVPGW